MSQVIVGGQLGQNNSTISEPEGKRRELRDEKENKLVETLEELLRRFGFAGDVDPVAWIAERLEERSEALALIHEGGLLAGENGGPADWQTVCQSCLEFEQEIA